jgi:sialate O-acetylesterase
MVLQQGMKVNIWGTANPGERVTVTLKDEEVNGVADSKGQWKVKLGPLSAGGPYLMTVAGTNTVTLHDVLVGEVWVCSGQSNMEMPVGTNSEGWSSGVANYQDEIARADYPNLRMFTVQKAVAARPQREAKGYWVVASPQTVNDFSAVGYFFARELLRVLNVPIGMIHSSWGGTPAESWTSRGTLEADPEFKSILDSETKLLSPYPRVFRELEQQLAQWRLDSGKIESEGAPVPAPPVIPDDPRRNPWRPAGLFNAMVMPASLKSRGLFFQIVKHVINRGTDQGERGDRLPVDLGLRFFGHSHLRNFRGYRIRSAQNKDTAHNCMDPRLLWAA